MVENLFTTREELDPSKMSWANVSSSQKFTNELSLFNRTVKLSSPFRTVNILRDEIQYSGVEISNGNEYVRTILQNDNGSVLVYEVTSDGEVLKTNAVRITREGNSINASMVLIPIASDEPRRRFNLLKMLSYQVFPVDVPRNDFAFWKSVISSVPKHFVRKGSVLSGHEVRGGIRFKNILFVVFCLMVLKLLTYKLKSRTSYLNEIRISDPSYVASLSLNPSNSNCPGEFAAIGNTIQVDPEDSTNLVNRISIFHVKDSHQTRPVHSGLKIM